MKNFIGSISASILQSVKRLSLKQKIVVFFVGTTFVILLLTIIYINLTFKSHAIATAKSTMAVETRKYALEIQKELEKDYHITQTLLEAAKQHYALYGEEGLYTFLKNTYSNILVTQPGIISVWDSWELKFLQENYPKDYGRIKVLAWREGGSVKAGIDTILVPDNKDYYRLKKGKTEALEEPYFDNFNNNTDEQILMSSIILPNIIEGEFAGMVGVDIALSHLHSQIKRIKPYPGSYALLLSPQMKIIAHPESELIGEDALEHYGDMFYRNKVQEAVSNGNGLYFEDSDNSSTEWFVTLTPITVAKCKQHWSLALFVPKSVVVAEASAVFWRTLLLGLLAICLMIAFIYFISNRVIINPIRKVARNLKNLSKGKIDQQMKVKADSSDEIGEMLRYLNLSVEALAEKTEFARQIGEGNYSLSLEIKSEEDTLGKSLLEMAKNLKAAQEEELKRKENDRKQQWISEGLAKFAEILRQNNDNIEHLGADIIKNLIGYLEIVQGGIFIYNDDDEDKPYFELIATYAYNRQKFIEKRILPGEGLVGTCAIEKKSIYLKEIPDSYIAITSGLGEAKPKALLIVPLLANETVLGIIELASFADFPQHHIQFVEQIAQSIGQTLISVRTNIRTAQLLERTKQQAEEMRAQEEEVRQNLEELATIKEELEKQNEENKKKQKELEWEKSLLDALLNYLPDKIYFKDLKSRFIKASKSTLKFFGLEKQEELIGKSDFDFFDEEHARPAYETEQRIISTDTPIIGIVEKEVLADGRVSWAETSKLPLKNPSGDIIGTFGITRDITESKMMEQKILEERENFIKAQHNLEKKDEENRALFEAITASTFVIEYTPEGNVSYINDAYRELLGISADEIIGKHHSYQVEFTDEQRKSYKKFWEDLNNGIIRKETLKFTIKGKTYLFYETYSPIKDENGEVYKILKIAVNVSHLLNPTENSND